MKKLLVLLLVIALMSVVFVGCLQETTQNADASTNGNAVESTDEDVVASDTENAGEKPLVALLMPNKEQTLWLRYGERLEEIFSEAGYTTSLEFADDLTDRQVSQIENAILIGAKYIVLAPVDGYAVSDSVEKAKDEGIFIIAADRLIMNTEAVDYYVTFDLVKLGEIQGEYIVNTMGLADGNGPFNLEIISGSPDDPNALLFYEGEMNVIQEYIDNEQLVVQSGQVSFDVTATLKWDSATAQSRMDNILSSYYSDGEKIDVILSAADCTALGAISSLESMGYGNDELPLPVITGQDCEVTAIKNILAGKQSMSIFLDPVVFSNKILELVESLNAGEEPTVDATYNNEAIDVPAVLYEPVALTKDNYELLIERGFYTEEDLAS